MYAGDEVVVESKILDIPILGRNEAIIMEQQLKTTDGELIVTTQNTTVSRGTAPAQED